MRVLLMIAILSTLTACGPRKMVGAVVKTGVAATYVATDIVF